MREESISKNLKVQLTEGETNDLARKLAKAQQDMNAAQDRKAEITSDLNAQIKRHHADVQELSRVIGNERTADSTGAEAAPASEGTPSDADVCPTCRGVPSSGDLLCPDCNGSGKRKTDGDGNAGAS